MKQAYLSFAIIVANTLVLLVGINALLYGYLWYRDSHSNPMSRYTIKQLLKAYPGWSEQDLRALEDPAWNEGRFTYDPISQVRQCPLRSKYLNVLANGVRQGATSLPWPPDKGAFNVFVFGGSTTFGIGVSDWDTIPSALQGVLRETSISRRFCVYNMGRPGFTSTGELLIFVSLLNQGFVPDVAIFIDGLNDSTQWDGIWGFGQSLSVLIDRSQATGGYLELAMAQTPLARAMKIMVDKLSRASGHSQVRTDAIAAEVMRRWLANKTFIERTAAAYNVKTCFVWQPVAVYNYDLQYDIARDGVLRDPRFTPVKAVYPAVGHVYLDGRFGSDFLYLADIQKDQRINLYVDAYHYTAGFSREIARRIGEFMVRKQFLTSTP